VPRHAIVPDGKAIFWKRFTSTKRAGSTGGKALFFRSSHQDSAAARPTPAVAPQTMEAVPVARPMPVPASHVGGTLTGVPVDSSGDRSLVGQRLGPYLVLSEIGRGGIGTCYRAREDSRAKQVALKVIHPWLARLPGFTSSLLAEIRATAWIRHPGIAAILDAGDADGHVYVVSELIDGSSVEDLIRREAPLAPDDALRIALQVASALDFVHTTGALHGDVKPSNAIVGKDGRAALTDLGLARLANAAIRLATVGAVLGSAGQMAPEVVLGQPVTSAADRYSFAVLLFELLTGQPPFPAAVPTAAMVDHVGKAPPRVTSLRPDLPAALDEVLARALAKDPAARYATCSDLVLAAAAALGSAPAASRARATGLRRMAGALAAIAVIVVAVIGTFVLSRGAPVATWTGRDAPRTAPATAASEPSTGELVSDSDGAPSGPPTASAWNAAQAREKESPKSDATATAILDPTPTPAEVARTPATPTAGPEPAAATHVGDAPSAPSTRSEPTPAIVQPAVSAAPKTPVGTLIVVRPNELGANDLHRMQLSSRSIESLGSPSLVWNWAPAPSPDGEWVVFATGAPSRADIAVMRRDGSGRRVVVRSGELNLGSPWWLPDSRIAFNGSRGSLSEIWAVSSEGGILTKLTDSAGLSEGTRIPTWPRAGGWLVFTGRQGGIFRVFAQPPGSGARPISPEGADAYAPAWAPHGGQIAFSGTIGDGRVGIFTMTPDGGDLRQLAVPERGRWACCPVWSPDGGWIAYVGNLPAGGDYGDVYVVSSEGGDPTRVTFDGHTYDWRLAWLP